jgi:RNA 3'-terminal phosphate cyclase (ATP)
MIGTAGATALVLHTVALPLAYAAKMPSEITITGGTHVMAAPSYDFLRTTWLGYQKRLGLAVTLEMVRPGFYPRGGGEIRASFMPVSSIRSLHLDQAVDLATASGFAATSQLPESIVKTMVRRLKHKLNMANIESEVRTEDWENGPAAVAGITFHHAPVPTTFVALGEKGKPPEDVADEVAAEAIEYRDSGCPVDPHSADQLLLPLVFVAGHSEFRVSEVTQHLLTNRDIIRQFVSREIEIDGDKRGLGLVRIGEQASDRLAEEDATGYDSEQHQG